MELINNNEDLNQAFSQPILGPGYLAPWWDSRSGTNLQQSLWNVALYNHRQIILCGFYAYHMYVYATYCTHVYIYICIYICIYVYEVLYAYKYICVYIIMWYSINTTYRSIIYIYTHDHTHSIIHMYEVLCTHKYVITYTIPVSGGTQQLRRRTSVLFHATACPRHLERRSPICQRWESPPLRCGCLAGFRCLSSNAHGVCPSAWPWNQLQCSSIAVWATDAGPAKAFLR